MVSKIAVCFLLPIVAACSSLDAVSGLEAHGHGGGPGGAHGPSVAAALVTLPTSTQLGYGFAAQKTATTLVYLESQTACPAAPPATGWTQTTVSAETNPDKTFFLSATAATLVDGTVVSACAYDTTGALVGQQAMRLNDSTLATASPAPTASPQPSAGGSGPTAPTDTYTDTGRAFKLTAYVIPSPDQLGAGSCLYMAATGLASFFVSQAQGIEHPALKGSTDVSAEFTLTLASQYSVANPYTDVMDLFASAGSYTLDRDLPFKAYGDESWVSGTGITLSTLNLQAAIPVLQKKVLYDAGGEGTQMTNHLMASTDLDAIKAALRQYRTPVLFVFHPDGVSYFHADLIYGFDDDQGTFFARDSSFGNQRTDIPSYNYDGNSQWGPQPYRDTYNLTYANAQAWGNHATIYFTGAGH